LVPMVLLLQGSSELSRDERYRAIHNLFVDKPGATSSLAAVLVLAAAIPLALWLAAFVQRRLRGEPRPQPRKLLWDLAAQASLSWWDRVLLLRVARAADLKDAGAMLLSANCFDRAVERWLAPPGREGAERLQRIRDRLFPDSR